VGIATHEHWSNAPIVVVPMSGFERPTRIRYGSSFTPIDGYSPLATTADSPAQKTRWRPTECHLLS
jgi:hypothetical protein